ncbi:Titin [Nymphon striatum]|nr:Titin [Nymphon striatum]
MGLIMPIYFVQIAIVWHHDSGNMYTFSDPKDPFDAPRFIETLDPKSVEEGHGVTLRCKVKGDPYPEIVWLKNDEQTDMVVVDPSMLGVPPTFVKAISALIVPEGEIVELKVILKGDPVPELTWYYNDQIVTSSDDIFITTEGCTSTLLIPEIYKSDTGRYEMKAVNCAGQAISTSHLTVITEDMKKIPPTFTKTLQNQNVPTGEPTLMDVEVDAEPQSIFTWYLNSKRIQPTPDFKVITKENKSTLIIAETFPDDQGEYTVEAENIAGKSTSTCTLSVHVEESEEDDTEPPEFVTNLQDVKVMDGEETKLVCRVSGNPRPKVTWYHNDREIRSTKAVRTTTTATGLCELRIPEVFPEDAGTYVCRAVNEIGETVETATLTVECTSKLPIISAPTMCMQLEFYQNTPIHKSKSKMKHCRMQRMANIASYEYIPDSEIASISVEKTLTPAGSEATLHSISEDELLDDILDEENTPPISPIPDKFIFPSDKPGEPPTFTSTLNKTLKPKEGEPVKLTCRVTGTPKPETRWYRQGKLIKTSEDFTVEEVEDRSTLTITRIFPDDSGEYTCEAYNPSGVRSTMTKITVTEIPKKPLETPITIDVKSRPTDFRRTRGATIVRKLENLAAPQGQKIIMRIHATGQPRPRVTWYHENTQITPYGIYRITETEDSSILHIQNVTTKVIGRYTAHVTNEFGTQTSTAEIQLAEPKQLQTPITSIKSPVDTQKAGVTQRASHKSFVISQVGAQPETEEPMTEYVRHQHEEHTTMMSTTRGTQEPFMTSMVQIQKAEFTEESISEHKSVITKGRKFFQQGKITHQEIMSADYVTEEDMEILSQPESEEEPGFEMISHEAEQPNQLPETVEDKPSEEEMPEDKEISESDITFKKMKPVKQTVRPGKPEQVKLKPTVRKQKVVEKETIDYSLKPVKREKPETEFEETEEITEITKGVEQKPKYISEEEFLFPDHAPEDETEQTSIPETVEDKPM